MLQSYASGAAVLLIFFFSSFLLAKARSTMDAVLKDALFVGAANIAQPPLIEGERVLTFEGVRCVVVCPPKAENCVVRIDGGEHSSTPTTVNEAFVELDSVLNTAVLGSVTAAKLVKIVGALLLGHLGKVHCFIWASTAEMAEAAICIAYRIGGTVSVLLEDCSTLPRSAKVVSYLECLSNRGAKVCMKRSGGGVWDDYEHAVAPKRWISTVSSLLRKSFRRKAAAALVTTDNSFCSDIDPEAFPMPAAIVPRWPPGHFEKIELEAGVTSCLAWHRCEQKQRRGVVVFFHGNGESVTNYPFDNAMVTHFRRIHWDVVLPEYRGYHPNMTSRPAQQQPNNLGPDVEVILRHVASKPEGGPIVVYGRSIGSLAAAEAMVRVPDLVSAVIVESGFSRSGLLARVMKRNNGAEDPSSCARHLQPLSCLDVGIRGWTGGPILVLHARDDKIVPFDPNYTDLSVIPRRAHHKRDLFRPFDMGQHSIRSWCREELESVIEAFLAP